MSNPCGTCEHFHLNRRLQYNTDYHGFVRTNQICGYNISNGVICFCEQQTEREVG